MMNNTHNLEAALRYVRRFLLRERNCLIVVLVDKAYQYLAASLFLFLLLWGGPDSERISCLRLVS